MAEHFTKESEGKIGTIETVEDAHKAHHLATADPEPERDGTMTGPAHEQKYGLERAEASAEAWRAAGVHPTENRALRPGDEGYQDPAEVAGVNVETAEGKKADETTAGSRARRS
ncbi:MAG TPA: hypothetical protein VFB19_18560 [Mycobacterium sp.]|nr:hypothetical protein [Mycobacterium sp.]